MARNSIATAPSREKRPEDKKSGWDDWEVRDCMYTLVRQKEEAARAQKIRDNAPLMKQIRAMAAKDLEEKRHERAVLTQLAKG